jgi:hypothetical protein
VRPNKKKGDRVVAYREVEADPGVADKRLLVVEAEFGGTLKVAARKENILSAVVRQAWDVGDLRTLTKGSPTRATGAHVGILGHITIDELTRLMAQGDLYNGLANRFLWVAARRSKILPFGGSVDEKALVELGHRLCAAAHFGRAQSAPLRRDAEADRLWEAVYPALSAGRPGVLGAVTSRAEAHVMRIALIYAVLDQSTTIKADHLKAGLALWDYCARSAAYIFGDGTGDRDVDAVLAALRAAPEGLTKNEVREKVFRGNKSPGLALEKLAGWRLAYYHKEETPGRHAERWFAGPPPA